MAAIRPKTKLSRLGIVTVAASLSMAFVVLTPNATFASQKLVSLGTVSPARSAPGLPVYLAGANMKGISAIHFNTKSITWVDTGKVSQIGRGNGEVSFITPKLASGSYKLQIVTAHGTSGTKAFIVVQDATQHVGTSCASEWVGYELQGAGGKLIACASSRGSARWVAPSQLPRSTHPILASPAIAKPVPVPTTTRTASTTTTTTTSTTTTTTTTLAPTGPSANATWSGYVVANSTPVTSVSSSWTVPQLNCAVDNGDSFDIWDGIGGYYPGEQLLQTGINATAKRGSRLLRVGGN